jgi:hypothetical protein
MLTQKFPILLIPLILFHFYPRLPRRAFIAYSPPHE